jgi:hypothetical protein
VDPSTLDLVGSSFLIGEKVLDQPSLPGRFNGPICPFNTDTACPNWTIAWLDAPFDTSPYDNQTLIFWVIVWMEENGALVQELPSHGLKSLPPASFTGMAAAATIEEPYSNNVGYFKWPFSVLPSGLSGAVPGPAQPSLQMSDIRTSARSVRPGAPAYVETRLRAGAAPFTGGASVYFYDGAPGLGGRLFDVEHVRHVRAGGERLVRVPFRSSVCGAHAIFVTMGRNTPLEQTARSQPIEVGGGHCGSGPLAGLKGKAERVGSGQANGKVSLAGALGVGAVDLSRATLTVRHVLTEREGADELLRGSSGGSVLPHTLTARSGSKATAALFESPSGAQPAFRIEVKQRDPGKGLIEVSLKAEKGQILSAEGCIADGDTAILTTSLTLNDGVNPERVLEWTQPWRCEKGRLVTP